MKMTLRVLVSQLEEDVILIACTYRVHFKNGCRHKQRNTPDFIQCRKERKTEMAWMWIPVRWCIFSDILHKRHFCNSVAVWFVCHQDRYDMLTQQIHCCQCYKSCLIQTASAWRLYRALDSDHGPILNLASRWEVKPAHLMMTMIKM